MDAPSIRRFLVSSVLAVLLAGCTAGRPISVHPTQPDASAAYRVYTADGAPSSLEAVAAAMDTADVMLVGEAHDDSVAHVVQRELLGRAFRRYGRERDVALSVEMFARDVQPVVDEYLAGLITERHFLAASRPWPNYRAAYHPLVQFARAHSLPVIAANAPRRYVNLVAREGRGALDSLSAWARQWLAPLPYAAPSPAYRAQFTTLMREMNGTGGASAHGAGTGRMLQAQALWDATMAYSLAEHLKQYPRALVLHLAGGFHVARGTGIAEHLKRYRPSAHVLSVVMQPVEDPAAFDAEMHAGLGDFVILTRQTGATGALANP